MRVKFIIGLLTLIICTARGQERKLTADSDTIYWQSYYRTILNEAEIEQIETIDNESVFRFWDGKKLIELRNIQNSTKGTVTFILKQYRQKKEGRLYFKKIDLTDETVKQLSGLLEANRLLEIPTYGQINGWDSGLDGRTYMVEYADKEILSFKNYWSPDGYKEKLSEAKQLTDFIEGLNKIDEINRLHTRFMNRQPFSSWYTFIGSATVASKIY